ncbi:hypothetical protein FRB94_014691 [Tulasnella sp. JGI-2019a]|nr:hypothetical protein FRB94_014691 [Tulasnella sp. JGI-2019a]
MGQYWQILNLDAEQTRGSWGKLGEFFTSRAPDVLFRDLHVPGKVSFDSIISATQTAYSEKADYEASGLYRRTYQLELNGSEAWVPEGESPLHDLPTDVVKLLFDSIDNLQDAICVGLTCKRLLELGLDRVNQLLSMTAAHWAGDRLICIGDYAKNHDMPPGVLTDEEKAFLEDEGLNLYGYAGYFDEVHDNRWSHFLRGDTTFVYRLSSVEIDQYREIVGTANDDVEDVVLCNLSKREYLRQDAVKAHGRARFGNFLLSRICWSSDGSVSMCYKGDIHRGIWAGDRFKITPINALEGGVDNWKDVSDEMGKEMAAVWESEYGPHWQNQRP